MQAPPFLSSVRLTCSWRAARFARSGHFESGPDTTQNSAKQGAHERPNFNLPQGGRKVACRWPGVDNSGALPDYGRSAMNVTGMTLAHAALSLVVKAERGVCGPDY